MGKRDTGIRSKTSNYPHKTAKRREVKRVMLAQKANKPKGKRLRAATPKK